MGVFSLMRFNGTRGPDLPKHVLTLLSVCLLDAMICIYAHSLHDLEHTLEKYISVSLFSMGPTLSGQHKWLTDGFRHC